MSEIAVIGLGKLGLGMAAVYAYKGYDVLGIDMSDEAISAARDGVPLIHEARVSEMLAANKARLRFDNSFEGLADTQMSFIIVPTPTKDGEHGFSNDYVLSAIESVGMGIRHRIGYHVVTVVSTVMPQSMDRILTPALEKASGKKVGRDVGLCYSPEFIALGTLVNDMLRADIQLIGASDERAGNILGSFYNTITPDTPLYIMSFLEAELAKLLLNVALSSRITYANLVGRIADVFGVDAHKILGAITSDRRIGSLFMKPGSPISGPCLLRDLKALAKVVKDIGVPSDLPSAMLAENTYLLAHVKYEIMKDGPCKVAILGWSYKAGTSLTYESAAFSLAEMLVDAGCQVQGYDPQAPIDVDGVTIACSADEAIAEASVVYVHTAWPEFGNISSEKLRHKRVIDFWGVTKKQI